MSTIGNWKLTLDVSQDPHILTRDEIDRHTLPAKSSTPPDAMDVVLTVARQVIIDN